MNTQPIRCYNPSNRPPLPFWAWSKDEIGQPHPLWGEWTLWTTTYPVNPKWHTHWTPCVDAYKTPQVPTEFPVESKPILNLAGDPLP